jgi:hypothetical protein
MRLDVEQMERAAAMVLFVAGRDAVQELDAPAFRFGNRNDRVLRGLGRRSRSGGVAGGSPTLITNCRTLLHATPAPIPDRMA